jgi:hypothetical protein
LREIRVRLGSRRLGGQSTLEHYRHVRPDQIGGLQGSRSIGASGFCCQGFQRRTGHLAPHQEARAPPPITPPSPPHPRPISSAAYAGAGAPQPTASERGWPRSALRGHPPPPRRPLRAGAAAGSGRYSGGSWEPGLSPEPVHQCLSTQSAGTEPAAPAVSVAAPLPPCRPVGS